MGDKNCQSAHHLPGMMAELAAAVPDARKGLPEAVFLGVSRLVPMVNVDLLLEGEGGEKLLTWRSDGFYGPGWHIPGGIVRFKETLAQRAALVAQIELGAEIEICGEPLTVREIMHPNRDVRGHFISFLLPCRLKGVLPEHRRASGAAEPLPGEWAWFVLAPDNLISQHTAYLPFLNAPMLRRPS